MTTLAVRYTYAGEDTPTVVLVASPAEQATMLRDLLACKGIVAEAGEQAFVPDPAIAQRVAREYVEKTVAELIDGERTPDQANEALRPLSPGLLDDDEAETIRRKDRNAYLDGCVRTTRIEELADLMHLADTLDSGMADTADRDIDADDRQREWLIRVLAGQENHSGMDATCHRCATVVRAKHTSASHKAVA